MNTSPDSSICLLVPFQDDWRDVPVEKQVTCTLCNIASFPDFIPLKTNGLVVFVQRCDGQTGIVHLSNVLWPKKGRRASKPRAKRETDPRKHYTLADLLP